MDKLKKESILMNTKLVSTLSSLAIIAVVIIIIAAVNGAFDNSSTTYGSNY